MVARLELTAVSVSFYGCIDLSINDCKSEWQKSQQYLKWRIYGTCNLYYSLPKSGVGVKSNCNLYYSLNDTALGSGLLYNKKEGVTGELEK